MQRFAVMLGIVLGWPLHAEAQERTWKEYVYPDDHFAISAPEEPKRDSQRIRVVGGTSTAHIYSIAADEHGAFMVFVYLRHRSDRRPERDVRQEAGSGALRSVKGKLLAEAELALGRYRGAELDVEEPGEAAGKGHRIRNRYYIVGRRVYQLMVIAPAGERFPAETERWFKSFRLVRGARRR
jgi:hypothetical protein